eukprot:TRINITY_DN4587_c0_g1_i1.p1 TRINITY_DN4587_c0_g1~~TRINITY_DN4587_c0_g1_i1.p1  ORF type:complete len:321 (-),score=68.91 TRINITY_DN4587_c0_g1_i1:252-1214(-)
MRRWLFISCIVSLSLIVSSVICLDCENPTKFLFECPTARKDGFAASSNDGTNAITIHADRPLPRSVSLGKISVAAAIPKYNSSTTLCTKSIPNYQRLNKHRTKLETQNKKCFDGTAKQSDECFAGRAYTLKNYTLDSNLYSFSTLNRMLRVSPEDISNDAIYENWAIELLYASSKKRTPHGHKTLYRCTGYADIKDLAAGEVFYWESFTSTSYDRAISIGYLCGKQGFCFEIEASESYEWHVESCSIVPDEKEIIIAPFSLLQVTEAAKKDGAITWMKLKHLQSTVCDLPKSNAASISFEVSTIASLLVTILATMLVLFS